MTKYYVITMDIPESLGFKYGIPEALSNPQLNEALDDLQQRFVCAFQMRVLDGSPMIVLPAEKITAQISTTVQAIRGRGSPLVIGLDRVYDQTADFYLEITRETDPLDPDREPKITNRFGTPPIHEQLRELQRMVALKREQSGDNGAHDEGVIITDVGSFGGGTLTTLSAMLGDYDVPICGVVLGLMPEQNVHKVRAIFGDRIQVINQIPIFEWLELRDLFLIDGRKPPESYTSDGVRRYIPYTDNLEKWASISDPEKRSICAELCKGNYEQTTGLLRGIRVDVTARIGEFVHTGQAPLRTAPEKMRSFA